MEKKLHYWYINEINGHTVAHGIVSGHNRLADSTFVHTSSVKNVETDFDSDEVVVSTKNSIYHCPLEYCKWDKQDEFPEIIPEYEKAKELYNGKIFNPSIEDGKVLLVLANFCDYYFHSLYCVPENSSTGKPCEYNAIPHIGMFVDSFLIFTEKGSIDLRYSPHYEEVEFYSEDTEEMPLYIENLGDITLYAKTSVGRIKLQPGERKEVIAENAEDDV